MDDSSPPSSRRALLGASAGLAGALALFASEPAAACSADARSTALSALLDEAVRTGDLEAAIGAHGEGARLTSAQLGVLRTLTKAELTTLQQVRVKLMKVTDGTEMTFVTSW